jgi:hypothetical protein
MSLSISSPVTGAAITGLTNPTHTLTADTAPDSNAKAYVVTTLGGTQTNARTHSQSDPFSLTFWKPKVAKLLPNITLQGTYPSVPVNQYAFVTKKGVYIDSNNNVRQMTIKTMIEVPAGADTNDAVNIKSALSLHSGVLFAEANDMAELAVLGTL